MPALISQGRMIEEQQRAESGEGPMIVAMAPLDFLSIFFFDG
jgi:hypothetical protein